MLMFFTSVFENLQHKIFHNFLLQVLDENVFQLKGMIRFFWVCFDWPWLVSSPQTIICERFGVLATRRICGLAQFLGTDEKDNLFVIWFDVNGELLLDMSWRDKNVPLFILFVIDWVDKWYDDCGSE